MKTKAPYPGLATLLSAEFLKLVALSCLIAFPVAWWVMHGWQAIRAALSNPVKSLRTE